MVIGRLINHDSKTMSRTVSFEKRDTRHGNWDSCKFKEEESGKTKASDNCFIQEHANYDLRYPKVSFTKPKIHEVSPRTPSDRNAAAIKLQKVYKGHRTRRNLADCAVVVEELWWKALDFAALKQSSISFFKYGKSETAVSRWARARTRVAKVGKGLSKDEKARKLALRHWLEAIDPRHRYGHNLHLYYDVWFNSESSQPFFYWLDIGDGKEVNVEKCPRTILQRQCIIYLRPKEREPYEVIVEGGKLIYRKSGLPVETGDGTKWIFVLSTTRNLYIGQKKKGQFQHSSFVAGGATIAAGRVVAHNGVLEAIWPYSGHYCPTEENFMEFISFLKGHHVNLTHVKKYAVDDDKPPTSLKYTDEELKSESITRGSSTDLKSSNTTGSADAVVPDKLNTDIISVGRHDDDVRSVTGNHVEAPAFKLAKRLSFKWTSGTGPRIGCVREYPPQLQLQALEHVNLSPRTTPGHFPSTSVPIPSPRPSPKIHLSPTLAYMGSLPI
ncbi:IQ domain-containing protein IQM1-like [Juglans microcarpa x Juglans regia]|uniref:IQ domain-containing protein IQM1-like n=1 Tax=Juglans microcarpa x Juglans regia TaxID=2249226 RepID=UPI001B7DD4FF|nr:IQ domain-containing protein IQM1-like [Juglans microcarpa x Juglans regia]